MIEDYLVNPEANKCIIARVDYKRVHVLEWQERVLVLHLRDRVGRRIRAVTSIIEAFD